MVHSAWWECDYWADGHLTEAVSLPYLFASIQPSINEKKWPGFCNRWLKDWKTVLSHVPFVNLWLIINSEDMIPGSCSWLNAGAGQCRQMRAACRVLMVWMLIFCQRWRLYKSCCSEGKVRSDVWNFSLWCSPLISQSPVYPTSLFCNMANNACMHCHLPTHTHTHVCIHTHPNWHTYIYMQTHHTLLPYGT